MAGIRTSAVINVGTATLAAFIGAGGLGDPIVAGLALTDSRMILAGAIPAALLAVLVDAGASFSSP
jgi:osmoprotectant transport system permease protein